MPTPLSLSLWLLDFFIEKGHWILLLLPSGSKLNIKTKKKDYKKFFIGKLEKSLHFRCVSMGLPSGQEHWYPSE